MSEFCCTDPACFCGGYKEGEVVFEAVSIDSYERLEQEIEKLREQNKLLIEALGFYASPENWTCEVIAYGIRDEKQECEFIASDDQESDYAGKRARECLEKIKGMK